MMKNLSFSSLGLVEPILSSVAAEGYTSPTPIQAESIPSLLAGRDLLATAQTGTGKTAAFVLPIVQLLLEGKARGIHTAPRSCRVLIVAPTRELAAQIDTSIAAYSKGSNLAHTVVFGGVGKSPQTRAMGRGVDILTATPGRLLDLHSEGTIKLDGVGIVVLDEADRMLDMGFIQDVRRIMALIPKKRQTMLFSATMPPDIAKLAANHLSDPVRVSVSPEKPAVELIDQKVAFVEKGDKRAFLSALIAAQGTERAIVFTRTKHGADRLSKALHIDGIPSAAIHANKSQNNRTRTMEDFRAGRLRILVATDLAARGIDVDGISHIYNYELPEVAETYVHRIGRTARAGASGSAVALCDTEEKSLLRAIEKLLRRPVPVAAGPEFDAAYEAARIARAAAKANPEAERERAERERPERHRDPRSRNAPSRGSQSRSAPPRSEGQSRTAARSRNGEAAGSRIGGEGRQARGTKPPAWGFRGLGTKQGRPPQSGRRASA